MSTQEMDVQIAVFVINVEGEQEREVGATMVHWHEDWIDVRSPQDGMIRRLFRVFEVVDHQRIRRNPVYALRHGSYTYGVHLTPEQEAIGATW